MSTFDLLKLPISEIAPKIKAKEVSPVELTAEALSYADSQQADLNSFISILYDQALLQAKNAETEIIKGEYKSPLHGIPIGIKDNIATAGIRTTLGSKVLSDHIPQSDAHVVTRCREAGAIILGKENLEEFAMGAASNNPHFGAVHNPWNLDHTPGGSSGGGGANTASFVTFASLGTDFGGSVRMPASFCGVVGLKQTFGLVSQRGMLGTTFNGDHIGPLVRTVKDCAILLQVIAGYDALDPSTVPIPIPDYLANLDSPLNGITIGIPSNYYFEVIDPEIQDKVLNAIKKFEDFGVKLKSISLPNMKYAAAIRAAALADSLVLHEKHIRSNRGDYSDDSLYRALAGQFVLGRDYSKALKVQRIIKEEYLRAFQEVDCIATPTTPVAAPILASPTFTLCGEEHPLKGPGSGAVSKYTSPANATGLPAISIPCGLTSKKNLPIGLQLIGRPFDEKLLFRLGHAYERSSPMPVKYPPLIDV